MAKKSRRSRRSRSGKSRKPVAKPPQAAAPAKGREATSPPAQTPTTGLQEDYSYVIADLKRIALFASSIVAILVALSFIIK
jgi:hypothetical protein